MSWVVIAIPGVPFYPGVTEFIVYGLRLLVPVCTRLQSLQSQGEDPLCSRCATIATAETTAALTAHKFNFWLI